MAKAVNQTTLKIALLAIGLQDAGAGASTPALASIIASFPSFAPSTVMLIASVPAMVSGLVALLYGKLTTMFKKRTLLFFGLACFIIGGVAPFFLNNLWAIIAMRVIVGIGSGICFPMSLNLIADFYQGTEKDILTGYSSAVGGASGIIFQMVGGILTAAYGWHACFLAYLFILVIVVIVYFWLPEPEKKLVSTENVDAPKEKVKLPGTVFFFAFLALIWTMFNFVLITNTAIYIVDAGFGSPAAIGTVLSVMTAGAMFAGIIFGRLKKVMGNYIIPLVFLISFVAFMVVYNASGLTMFIVGGAIAGLALGLEIPTFSSGVTDVTTQASFAWAIGIYFVANSIAQFIQAPIYDIFINNFGMHYGRDLFLVSAVGFIAFAVITLVWCLVTGKKTKLA